MRDFYNLLGDNINLLIDKRGQCRGLRRRASETRLCILQGVIRLYIDDTSSIVDSFVEYIIPANSWHGWEALDDSMILQRLECYDESTEECKEFPSNITAQNIL